MPSTYTSTPSRKADVPRHAGHDLGLGLIEGGDKGPRLAVEVVGLETIEICDMEATDPQSRQRQHMRAADSTEACNGHTRPTNPPLLVERQPADVARRGGRVVVRCCRR
jgi:hypothetical protein